MNIYIQIYECSACINLSGCFDSRANRKFKDAYRPLFDNAAVGEIELELSKVTCMDSSALGMLVLLSESAKAFNRTVTLLNPSSVVSKLLEIANFSKIFNIRQSA